MSTANFPEAFATLLEMAKGPLLNPEDLSSYEIDDTILSQICPCNELQRCWPIPSGKVVDMGALELYLEEYFLELQPELSLDELEEQKDERFRQIEQGSPLTEGEEENQWEAIQSVSFITFFSGEYQGKTLYWAGEMEPSGMGHFHARSYGPFRSLDDAWSIVDAMNWPDVECD